LHRGPPGTDLNRSVDADLLATAFGEGFELHFAIDEGVDGEIAAEADVFAGMKAGAALTHDDGAGLHDFAIEVLDAEALALAIAAVLGTADALLMCHWANPS